MGRYHGVTVLFSLSILLCTSSIVDANEESIPAPDLGPNVRNMPRPKVNDDPEDAWAEWGETTQTRRNPMPKRQHELKPGMDIMKVIGSAMRQEKVLYAYLKPEIATTQKIGQEINSRYFNMMTGGGLACRTWYVHEAGNVKRQIVLKCETLRDGHESKGFLLKQPEVDRVNLDNLDFRPNPKDDDDSDADSEDEIPVAGMDEPGAKQEL